MLPVSGKMNVLNVVGPKLLKYILRIMDNNTQLIKTKQYLQSFFCVFKYWLNPKRLYNLSKNGNKLKIKLNF